MNTSQKKNNIYQQVRKKYWYFFPDLTVRFFIKEYKEERRYYNSLSRKEKQESRLSQNLWSFSSSLLLHLMVVFSLLNGKGFIGLSESSEEEAVSLGEAIVNFQITEGMVSAEVKPVYNPKSDIVVKPVSLDHYKTRIKLLALDELLKSLKSTKAVLFSNSSGSRSFSNKRGKQIAKIKENLKAGLSLGFKPSFRKYNQEQELAQLWSRVSVGELSKAYEKTMQYKDLMKVIDKNVFHFRECYEQALLKDEKLTVNAYFLLKLHRSKVRSTRVNLTGKGSFTAKRQMTNCLMIQGKKLVFANNKQNMSVKFNLIFGL